MRQRHAEKSDRLHQTAMHAASTKSGESEREGAGGREKERGNLRTEHSLPHLVTVAFSNPQTHTGWASAHGTKDTGVTGVAPAYLEGDRNEDASDHP